MTSVGELMLTMLQAGIHTLTALAPKPKVPQSLIHAKSSMFAKVRLSRQRSCRCLATLDLRGAGSPLYIKDFGGIAGVKA